MDIKTLEAKKNLLQKRWKDIPKETIDSFQKAFDIAYAHHSTAIEGNTLTLIETKVILEDKISIGGKSLREIYEVVNHEKAFSYVKRCIAEKKELNEDITKDIHALLMENIIVGGIYRNVEVRISGASFLPPLPEEMYQQMKTFFVDMKLKQNVNALELAAWTHAEFVRIHPFVDGNGRTARMLMNYQLMYHGYLPIYISKENRIAYYNALEAYATNEDIQPFLEMISTLEEEQLDIYLNIGHYENDK